MQPNHHLFNLLKLMYARDDIKIEKIRVVAKKVMEERWVLIILIAKNPRKKGIKKSFFPLFQSN